MDQAVSSRKLAQTFQKAVELEHVLEHKAELAAALAELSRSQESALRRALNQAVQRGLLRAGGGEARYGVVVIRHDAKAQVLAAACERSLEGSGIVVHATAAECELCAAINLMRQAAGGGVLVTSHEQLLRLDHDARSSRLERPAEGVPWSFFSLLVEYDALQKQPDLPVDLGDHPVVGGLHLLERLVGRIRETTILMILGLEIECILGWLPVDVVGIPME